MAELDFAGPDANGAVGLEADPAVKTRVVEEALGQHTSAHGFQPAPEPGQNGATLPRPQRGAQLRAGLLLAQVFFHGVELADLPHEPGGGAAFAEGFVEAAAGVGPAADQGQGVAAFAGQ